MMALWALMLLLCTYAYADTISCNVPYDYETSRSVVVGTTYRVYDNGGPEAQYMNNSHGSLVMTAPEGYVLHFVGTYNIQEGLDALKLFDSIASTQLFGVFSGIGSIDVISTSHRVKVEFVSDGAGMRDGFELTVTLVPVDPGNYQTEGCFNFTFLTGNHVVCESGTFSQPNEYEGYIFGRHTVMTDTGAYDPFTVDSATRLKVVPPGFAASVRLGNDGSGAQAERITYTYTVDTSLYDMLIMRYAAVLEDPGHSSVEQPKMTYRFVDEDGIEINSSCYSANFVAGGSLGWHGFTHGSNQGWYCDWTPVGIDLSPLHGQTIYIELTTYDCAEQGHFGYAYFVFSCTRKYISSTSCGNNIENTFTAPEGYSYTWCKEGSTTVLSRDRSLHVTSPGKYFCTLHSPGATGTACDIVIEAEAGGRFPFAQFDYRYTNPHSMCDGHVAFTNHSIICRDSALTIPSTERCEAFLWDFGDGSHSTEANPSHFFSPGTYNVTLTAMLADGECSDVCVHTVEVIAPTRDELTIELCDGTPYHLYDTVLNTPGTYERDSACHHRVVHLQYVETLHTTVRDTVVENQLPHSFRNCLFDHEVQDSVFYLTAVGNCDSLVHYWLTIHPNHSYQFDTTVCESHLPLQWGNQVFDSASTLADTLIDQHGADSIVLLTLHTWPSYSDSATVAIDEGNSFSIGGQTFNQGGTYTIPLTSSQGCDSTLFLTLIITRLSLYAPNIFTPDQEGNNRFFFLGENLLDGHVWIYERRGLLVTEFDLVGGSWDGTKEGQKLPQGTYVWLCRYRSTFNPDKHFVEKGTITLLR